MKILDKFIDILEKLCGLMLIVMTVVTFAQAFNRYVLGNSFTWAEEFVIMGMVWITFLGSTVAVRKASHTRIDFLINLLPTRGKEIVEGIGYVLMAVFCGLLFYYSIAIVQNNMTVISPGLMLPRALLYLSITVGMACMVFFLLLLAVCKFIGHDLDGGNK